MEPTAPILDKAGVIVLMILRPGHWRFRAKIVRLVCLNSIPVRSVVGFGVRKLALNFGLVSKAELSGSKDFDQGKEQIVEPHCQHQITWRRRVKVSMD